MSKNLNECSGCLIINNDENIALPPVGKTNAYDVDLEKPCFFVNNHYISPVQKCYSVKLANPVNLEYCDKLRINIKIPKHIFGEQYGYSLEDVAKTLANNENFLATLRLKTSDGCIDINRVASETNQLDIEDYCGWINITIHYQVGEVDPSREEICNLCEIAYSLCFEPIKLKTLYGACSGGSDEVAEFRSETCLEIENVAAQRQAVINSEMTITGPEDFLCLTVSDAGSGPTSVSFDKFSKTLTISYDFVAGESVVDVNAAIVAAGLDSVEWVASGNDLTGGSAGTTKTTYTPKP
jgi:hypothetical protein